MCAAQFKTAVELFQHARRLHDAGDLREAESFYVKALECDSKFAEAWFQLGVLAVAVNKLSVAAQMMTKASVCQPREFSYHRALCEVHRRLEDFERSLFHGSKSVLLGPEDADSFYNYGLAMFDAGRFGDAVKACLRVVEIAPEYGLAYNNMGAAYEKLGDAGAARKAYETALEINPRHCEALHNLGSIHNEKGLTSEAKKLYLAAIEVNPDFVYAHHSLAALKKYQADDVHVEMVEGMVAKAAHLPVDIQVKFWFTLGKIRSDLGRHQESFEAYTRGNALYRQTISYEGENVRRHIVDVVTRFDCNSVEAPGTGCADATPIFVLGMPRSGSTLIEQILDSHPQVKGAGELSDFSDLVGELSSLPPGASYVDWLSNADPEQLRELGDRYLERLRGHSSQAVRIVDKMPGNFFYVGMIYKIFPHARVIHSMRNPMDICVSNFTKLYKEAMHFAYDLKELGQFCRLCDDMMAHWKASLPSDFIYESRYEALVTDLEGQTRGLLDFCGLPWDDACLAFHQNTRNVKTASRNQVVKPVYRSSVGRWAKYASQLAAARESYEQESSLFSSSVQTESAVCPNLFISP